MSTPDNMDVEWSLDLLTKSIRNAQTLGWKHKAKELTLRLDLCQSMCTDSDLGMMEVLHRFESKHVHHTKENEDDVISSVLFARVLAARNPYETLRIGRHSTKSEIKLAFMTVSESVNPRLNKVQSANLALSKVDDAFKLLSSTNAMRHYNKFIDYLDPPIEVTEAFNENNARTTKLLLTMSRRFSVLSMSSNSQSVQTAVESDDKETQVAEMDFVPADLDCVLDKHCSNVDTQPNAESNCGPLPDPGQSACSNQAHQQVSQSEQGGSNTFHHAETEVADLLPSATRACRKVYHCEQCSVSCTTKFNMKRHVSRYHSSSRKSSDSPTMNSMQRYNHNVRENRPDRLKCACCEKKYRTISNLSRHVKGKHRHQT